MTFKPHNTARTTSATLLWLPLDAGKKAKISAGMQKATTKMLRMERQQKSEEFERGRKKSEKSKRQKKMPLPEHLDYLCRIGMSAAAMRSVLAKSIEL